MSLTLPGNTYPRTICSPVFGIAGITRIINTCQAIRTPDSCNSSASLGFCCFTFTLMIDRNTCRSRSTGITISFSVTTANRIELSRADCWPGFTDTLRISNFALADAQITVLLGRTGQSLDRAANLWL